MTFLLQYRMIIKRPAFGGGDPVDCTVYVEIELTHVGGEECVWNSTPTTVDCEGVPVNVFGSAKLDGGDTWLLNLNSGIW